MNNDWQFNHYQEFEKILVNYDIKPKDICFVGGMSLSALDLRNNNDIDFIIGTSAFKKISNDIKHIRKDRDGTYIFSQNVDLKTNWANCIGISDDKLIYNDKYYFYRGKYKVARLEITFSVKNSLRRNHDKRDIKLIEKKVIIPNYSWDWDLFIDPKNKENIDVFNIYDIYSHVIKRYNELKIVSGHEILCFLIKSYKYLIKKIMCVFRIYLLKIKYYSIINNTSGGPILKYSIQNLLAKQYNYGKFDRMDLIVRYLATENYYGQNNFGFNLYNKMQQNRINRNNFENQYIGLIKSIANNGFDEDSKIEIDSLGNIVDGSHRLALAMYFQEKEIAINISYFKKIGNYSIDWFKINNFDTEEIKLIEHKYYEVFQKLGMFFYIILWPPIQDYFTEIENDLKKSFKIITSDTYQMENHFDDFVRDIYAIDDIDIWKIERKIHSMQQYTKRVHIITIESLDPKFRKKVLNNHDISATCEDIKKKYRKIYSSKVSNYIYDIIIHTSDNYKHNKKIAETLVKYFPSNEKKTIRKL